ELSLIRYPLCAAASIFVSFALISQALGVLRPLFPAKAAPPFSSEMTRPAPPNSSEELVRLNPPACLGARITERLVSSPDEFPKQHTPACTSVDTAAAKLAPIHGTNARRWKFGRRSLRGHHGRFRFEVSGTQFV